MCVGVILWVYAHTHRLRVSVKPIYLRIESRTEETNSATKGSSPTNYSRGRVSEGRRESRGGGSAVMAVPCTSPVWSTSTGGAFSLVCEALCRHNVFDARRLARCHGQSVRCLWRRSDENPCGDTLLVSILTIVLTSVACFRRML